MNELQRVFMIGLNTRVAKDLYFLCTIATKIFSSYNNSNGIFTMLPFAVGFISSNGSAVLSDILITKGLGVSFTRRIMSSLATYIAAVALFVATFASPGHSTLPVTCFMMCNFFLQINKSGCFMNGTATVLSWGYYTSSYKRLELKDFPNEIWPSEEF